MDTQLTEVIKHIGMQYAPDIEKGSRYVLELDLGREAEKLGFASLGLRLRGVEVVVPVKKPFDGMKVLIDGRTFVNYAEYDSGVAAPGFVAGDVDLPAVPYRPADSLIRQFH